MALAVKKGFAHFYYETNAQLAAAIAVSGKKETNIYFGCASFKDRSTRAGSNTQAMRSFWVDIDVGPKKPYATLKDAARAVLSFALKLGLPQPLLVNSGWGLHGYWTMDADMPPSVWKATASILKAAMMAEGVGQDPTRTADLAAVLRPPGSYNHKREPKLVSVVIEGETTQLDVFQKALEPYAHLVPAQTDAPFELEGGPAAEFETGDNDDLTGGLNYGVSNADLIATKCAQIKRFFDAEPGLPEPTWYKAIGVVAFCEDGPETCHTWSAKDSRYDKAQTQTKINQVTKLAPTTCAAFAANDPTICAGCPHNGKVKSPIVLGRGEGEVIIVQRQEKQKDGTWLMVKVVEEGIPNHRIKRVGGHLVLEHNEPVDEQKDKTIIFDWVQYCPTALQPITRMWIEGVAHVECEMELKDGVKRRFLLEGGIIGKGKDTLAAELARNEIVCLPGKTHLMDTYLKQWLTRLKETADQVVAHRHFGWSERNFVLGNNLMGPGGLDQRAIVVGMAKSKTDALEPRGTLADWVTIVDRAYNAPGQEAFQFLVACAFAAPLLSMMKQVSGVTVFAHSEGSGIGKTTAQKVGLSAWGNYEQLMLAEGKVTTNALWGLMGAYHSLPIVFDELTNTKNEVASELVFSVSSGRSKERMQASGELRENNSNWCTILMASGNNLLSEKLALHRGNAEAEISRLFEFTLEASPHLTPNEANVLFPKLLENYGHAGQLFARYVVENYDVVEAMLTRTQAQLNSGLGITQVERYWSALLASVLVSVALCRNLKLLSFDLAALKVWMVARLQENRIGRDQATASPLELFGSMLTDMWEGILVTHGEGDIRQGRVATVLQKPRGTLVGRSVVPVDKNEVPALMLNSQAVRNWSNEKGVSAREMFGAAVRAGWCDPDLVRYSLGRGTLEYAQTSSYVSCWKLDPRRVADAIGDRGAAQKIMGVFDGSGGIAAGGVQ